MGEPFGEAWANPNSKTWTEMKSFMAVLYNRYKNSPALYGWEFANEFSLWESLNAKDFLNPYGSRTVRDSRDDITAEKLIACLSQFGTQMRALDPNRMITSGNAQPRGSANNLRYFQSWNSDTRDQFKQVVKWDNPAPLDVISVHMYGEEKDRRSPMDTYEGIIAAMMEVSAETKQPLYLGEFGYPVTSEQFPQNEKETFTRQIQNILNQKVPLSAVWNFFLDYDYGFDIDPRKIPARAYQLEMVLDANRIIYEEMK
jgi:endo-1,4-beta-mannosidase